MAAVAIRPEGLIDLSRDLARHQSGAGRPRPVWLRRAASGAYYAVFHAFSRGLADHLLADGDESDRLRLTRSVGHAPLREVCGWVTGGRNAGKQHVRPIVSTLQAHAHSRQVADITFRLQEYRHRADYDHLAPFDKASVLSAINESEYVVSRISAMSGSRELGMFFSLIALQSQLR